MYRFLKINKKCNHFMYFFDIALRFIRKYLHNDRFKLSVLIYNVSTKDSFQSSFKKRKKGIHTYATVL